MCEDVKVHETIRRDEKQPRATSGQMLRQKADYLKNEARQLEELAKLMDVFPMHIEEQIFPYIEHSIYCDRRYH